MEGNVAITLSGPLLEKQVRSVVCSHCGHKLTPIDIEKTRSREGWLCRCRQGLAGAGRIANIRMTTSKGHLN